MRRFRALSALAAVAAVLLLAACGGGGDDSYKTDARAATAAVSAVGDKLGSTIQTAGSSTDTELAAELDALKTQADAALKKVNDLQPPDDSAKALVESLSTALTKATADIGALADAVSTSDAATAKSATVTLLQDSPAVKTANQALRSSVK